MTRPLPRPQVLVAATSAARRGGGRMRRLLSAAAEALLCDGVQLLCLATAKGDEAAECAWARLGFAPAPGNAWPSAFTPTRTSEDLGTVWLRPTGAHCEPVDFIPLARSGRAGNRKPHFDPDVSPHSPPTRV